MKSSERGRDFIGPSLDSGFAVARYPVDAMPGSAASLYIRPTNAALGSSIWFPRLLDDASKAKIHDSCGALQARRLLAPSLYL